MYEGVNNNQGEDNQEKPFDYLAEAERMRQERLAKEATEKAERDAKDKQKREERIAKQLARSAAKREEIANKAKDLEESTDKAKDQVAEVKRELKDIQKDVEKLPAVPAQPEDVVYMGTSGSEVTTMGLENGEGATIELQHDIKELDSSVKRTEETIAHADEVSARAEAIASERDIALDRARSAILGVAARDVTTHTESGSVPYDLTSEQQELGDRIQHTWEGAPAVVPEQLDVAEEVVLTPYAPTGPGLDFGDNGIRADQVPSSYGYTTPSEGTIERSPDPVSPITTTIRSGAAFVGGLFAGRTRANALRRSLDTTDASLSRQTQEIKRDVESIQTQSISHEYAVPKQMETPAFIAPVAVQMQAESTIATSPEIHGTDAPAIPAWIKQVESDIKKGKVVELKKWQQDVLRIQHPDLMKQYEKLDYRTKEIIKNQSKETLSAQFLKPTTPPKPLGVPGDLPTPIASMPAYMNPSQPTASQRPVFDYANVASTAGQGNVTLSANGYLTIVMIGGIVFGAALIAAFGF